MQTSDTCSCRHAAVLGAVAWLGAAQLGCSTSDDPWYLERIGPAGGSVVSSGGEASLDVSAGALSREELIGVLETIGTVSGVGSAGRVFLLSPTELQFDKPVAATFSLPTGLVGHAAVYWSHDSRTFEPLSTTVKGDKATALVDQLGYGFVGSADGAPVVSFGESDDGGTAPKM